MMNWIGAVAALATFLSVWFGHVAVRKIEFISPTIWIPSTLFAILGLAVGGISLSVSNFPLSISLGILGTTLLFDSFEFTRQQKRIKKGHAPSNPNNPRHAKILTEYPLSTTKDLLKRDPIGHIPATREANQPISSP